jgi:RNA polymerase sigma factor (sigma-70 family)
VNPLESDQKHWFETELRPHEGALRAYLHARFTSLRDVDDIVQETYMRLLRAHSRGGIRSAKALLFTTARNAALDIFRRRRAGREEPMADFPLEGVLEEAPDAAENASHNQELEILASAVATLPDRCREVMVLRYRDGLACKEIALQLSLSPETIKVHLARGMRACAAHFAQHGLLQGRSANEAVS